MKRGFSLGGSQQSPLSGPRLQQPPRLGTGLGSDGEPTAIDPQEKSNDILLYVIEEKRRELGRIEAALDNVENRVRSQLAAVSAPPPGAGADGAAPRDAPRYRDSSEDIAAATIALRVIERRAAEELAGLLRQGELVLLLGGGHDPLLRAPCGAAVLRAWLLHRLMQPASTTSRSRL